MGRIQTIILCGGRGTRLREETIIRPKPLVPIGGMPVLWHIMKTYSTFGYKGDMIKEFFLNFEELMNNFTLNLRSQDRRVAHHDCVLEDWNITFLDTGEETPTGGRVKRAEKYIDGETFFLTYGDGLSNVDLHALLEYHRKMGKIGTLTAIHPTSPFGVIETEMGLACSFKEKPRLEGLINGGFFTFNRRFFSYLTEDSVLEEEPLKRLTAERELAVYEHSDFWQCVDTFKDVERLNKMWDDGERPWVTWS